MHRNSFKPLNKLEPGDLFFIDSFGIKREAKCLANNPAINRIMIKFTVGYIFPISRTLPYSDGRFQFHDSLNSTYLYELPKREYNEKK